MEPGSRSSQRAVTGRISMKPGPDMNVFSLENSSLLSTFQSRADKSARNRKVAADTGSAIVFAKFQLWPVSVPKSSLVPDSPAEAQAAGTPFTD